ncbi:NrdR family transcriptional regulator [Leptolyngbya valderiana BDU 20041]|uniref:transcriptional regulator NrdR n=1 Tax=Baaleninema simplex TaxID=2862350 RepID=UPI0003458947|nr:transcriptional regulator NrdR [Baaleninema simplex]MDC0833647.1 transcriptional regulator NrdR [Geitlerinema sp. CS-897]OAB63320.1 NrdR family transcriptional regulator [Leptolyngbya valderiana BDU 20041]PPT09853.1 Ribonucleotide reductase transcriptional regulator NrdR [Geitlerinema sp. FC II]
MRCPFCQHTESRVLESRSTESGQSVRRRRQCLACSRRFTTYERIEFVPITTIKRDGKRESFDRSKLLRGMVRACEKTSIAHEQLEAIVDEIEAKLQQRPTRQVSTHEIGEIVLSYLKDLSEVAYVRFASVYQKFQGVRDFVDTLDRLRASRLELHAPCETSDIHSAESESETPPSCVARP